MKQRLASILLLTTFVSIGMATPKPSSASVLSDLATQMQPGSWAELTTNGFSGDFLLTDSTAIPITQYANSASWDPSSRRFLFIGSPHQRPTKFIIYTESTNTWSSGSLPLSCMGLSGTHSTTGSCTAHAYDHNTINFHTGTHYYRSFSATLRRRLFKYDAVSGVWGEAPAVPSALPEPPGTGALEYFPELGGVVLVTPGASGTDGRVYLFNLSTNQWSLLTDGVAMGSMHPIAEYNPIHKVLIFGGGNESSDMYKLDASGQVTTLAKAPVEIRVASGSTGTLFTTDATSGKHLIIDDTGQFYAYDVPTDTWALQGSTPPIISRFTIAAPVSTYGVIMFVTYDGSRSQVRLYKHTSGSDPSITPVAPTELSIGNISTQ